MSDYLGSGLRTVDPAPPAAAPGRELAHRVARRGDRDVVTLRCVEAPGGFAVECDVVPVGSPDAQPQRRGPYAFATESEARQFVDEATTALQYLGCDVFETGA
jgi:hypothetical protein